MLRDLSLSTGLNNASTGLVLLNLVLMCMPYYGMSETYGMRLELGATLISWLFIIEMGVKLLGLGCAGYWADGWNQLDGTIVTMSIVEMVLTALFAGSGVKLSFLRILRMLRVARMLRLMKSWKGLYKIISTVVKAVPQMSNVLILVFLINMIFALLGMQVEELSPPAISLSPPSHLPRSPPLSHAALWRRVRRGRVALPLRLLHARDAHRALHL